MALLVLTSAAAALVWFTLSPAQRAELELVLLRASSGALIASAASIVGAGVLLALVVRRKSRFLTSAVKEAHADYAPKMRPRERIFVRIPLVAFSIAGLAVYAYSYLSGVTRWLFLGMLEDPKLATLRGGLVLLTTAAPAVLIPCYVALLLNGTGITRRLRDRVLDTDQGGLHDKRLPDPGDYQGSGTKPVFLLGARETKVSRHFEREVAIPSWVTFAAPSIFGGLLIFGRKGSGKTSLLLRMLEGAIRFQAQDADQMPAICVPDQKGDIAELVVAKAKLHGREADVTRFGVGTEAKWNPFGELGPASSALECRQVGFFMRCAMTAGTASSMKASFWQDNADNLIFRLIHLLALPGESVGFGSVYKLITSANAENKWRHELYTRADYGISLCETQDLDDSDGVHELDGPAKGEYTVSTSLWF